MLYFDFETNSQAYKLRLTTKTIMELEKKIGCNPLMIFGNGTRIPTINEMVAILWASLQANHHGITFDKATSIFENYLEEGHTPTEFIPVIVEIYKVSGIIKIDETGEEAEKNS